MTRTLFLAASVLSLASIAACGGSAKKADIESFEASPSILPSLGGEVTLTWQVRGASELEIEPGVGVVTGTSLTLTVTETTTFELIAKRNGTRVREETTVTLQEPEMVVGSVRSMLNGTGIPDAVVVIDGHDPVLTDDDGLFAVSKVATPYRVTIVIEGGAFVYEGLTRFDPTLDVPLAFSGVQREIQLAGAVSPVPAPAGTTTQVTSENDFFFDTFFGNTIDTADATTGAYNLNSVWLNGPVSADVTLHGLRYQDPGPVTEYFYGTTTLSADDGDSVTGADLTLTSAGASETSIAITNVDGYTGSGDEYFGILLGEPTGTAADHGFLLPPEAIVYGTSNDAVLTVPDFQDATVVFGLPYQSELTGSLGVAIETFPIGTESVTIEIQEPARPLIPVDQGSIDPAENEFVVDAPPDTVKIWFFILQGDGPQQFIAVVTTEDAVRLPDLEALGFSTEFMVQANWFVTTVGPRGSLDEVTGPGGILGTNPEHVGITQPRVAFLPYSVEGGGIP